MERIVVGIDGSEASSAALRWAARIAEPCNAELVAVHAVETLKGSLSHEQHEAVLTDAARLLEHWWCAPVRDTVPKLRTELVEGHPAAALLRVVEDEFADMAVVGTRGTGGFAGLHLGSAAHYLAHHTTRPLAIVPRASSERPVSAIIVGIDGSAGSAAATGWTADLAATIHARVIAVHAFEPFAEWVPNPDPRGWRHQAMADMHGWTAPLQQRKIDVEIAVVRDVNPVAALAAEAGRHAAGMIVVGARGLGGFPSLRLGRVPIQLVHHAQLPVTLVPVAGFEEA